MLKYKILSCFLVLSSLSIFPQKNPEKLIADTLTQLAAEYANVGRISVSPLQVNEAENTLTIIASDALSNIPFRTENVDRIYSMISNVTRKLYPDFKIVCLTDRQKIEDLIPNYYAKIVDNTKLFDTNYKGKPFITNLSRPYQPSNGLYNKLIALWQSHG
ncbi:MAG: xanthan lyase, partial [Paludibacter sp.]